MITKTIRQWTYEDVRVALEEYFDWPISGVRHCPRDGFIIEECPKAQQPWSSPQVEAGPISTPDMRQAGDWLKNPATKALGDNESLQPNERGVTGEPERRDK